MNGNRKGNDMTKRTETIALENWLFSRIQKGGVINEYGATEVTMTKAPVQFVSHEQEIHRDYLGRVDFISVSMKKTIRAYEIKVSMADFRSKAIKSWVGHYNYLVTTDELANKYQDEILAELPKGIGWLTPSGCVRSARQREPLIDVDWLIWLMMRSNAMALAKLRTKDMDL